MNHTYRVMTPAQIAAEFEHYPWDEIAAGRIRVQPDHIAIARANNRIRNPHFHTLPARPLTEAQKSCLEGT